MSRLSYILMGNVWYNVIIPWLSTCKGDNALAEARGLSPRTVGQTMVYLLLISSHNSYILTRMRSIGRLAPVLKTLFINVPYHILIASLTLMALFKTEPSELDWLQVYDMAH